MSNPVWSQDWVDYHLAKFATKEKPEAKSSIRYDVIDEGEFQWAVEKAAKELGWMVYHTHDSRGSAKGFPDLVLVRKKSVIFAELKTETGKLTPAQKRWIAALMAAGQQTYVWRPSDLDSIARILQAAT